MPKFDHHLHTSRHSPDSVIDPLVLIERARAVGLDGVVITEHDYQWEPTNWPSSPRGRRASGSSPGRRSRPARGTSSSTACPTSTRCPPGSRLADLLQVVRRHEAAIVAAHPFRWDQTFDAIVAAHGPVFDALELVSNNVTPETRRKTAALLATLPDGRDRLQRRPRRPRSSAATTPSSPARSRPSPTSSLPCASIAVDRGTAPAPPIRRGCRMMKSPDTSQKFRDSPGEFGPNWDDPTLYGPCIIRFPGRFCPPSRTAMLQPGRPAALGEYKGLGCRIRPGMPGWWTWQRAGSNVHRGGGGSTQVSLSCEGFETVPWRRRGFAERGERARRDGARIRPFRAWSGAWSGRVRRRVRSRW